MPSANDAFTNAAAKILAAFGQTITRWPRGEQAEAYDVLANVDLDNETMPGQLGGGPRVRDDMGERIDRTGLIDVAATECLDDRDCWEIDGEVWSTVREHSRDAGLVTIAIEREESLRTRRRRENG